MAGKSHFSSHASLNWFQVDCFGPFPARAFVCNRPSGFPEASPFPAQVAKLGEGFNGLVLTRLARRLAGWDKWRARPRSHKRTRFVRLYRLARLAVQVYHAHQPGSTATEPPKHPKTQKPNFTHSSHFQNRPKPIHNLFTVPKLLISVAFYGVDTPKTVNLVNNPPTLFTFAKNTPFCLSYANLRRLHRDPGHSTKISRKPRLQVHHSGSLRRPVQGRKPLVSLRNNAIPARPARGR